jgi:Bacterial Ig domain
VAESSSGTDTNGHSAGSSTSSDSQPTNVAAVAGADETTVTAEQSTVTAEQSTVTAEQSGTHHSNPTPAESISDVAPANDEPAASVTVTPVAASAAPSAAAIVVPTANDPWAMQYEQLNADTWQLNTAALITAMTANLQFLIQHAPLPPQLQDALTGTMWTLRRTFFNLAPTVDQTVTITNGLGGPIAGRILATDPENDAIVFALAQGPKYGRVTLNVDGTYFYTPGPNFEGVDTFSIAATDPGLHVNLLSPFRGGADTGLLVNQGAITFDLSFGTGANLWTDEAKNALYDAARRVAAYLIVKQPIQLTYAVNSVDQPGAFLANAGSVFDSLTPGFHQTIVQRKLLTGEDVNQAAADGVINWNWYYKWGVGTVASDQYDMTAVAMHELLHSLGWLSNVRAPDSFPSLNVWSVYDQFVTTWDGQSPIDPTTFLWNDYYNSYITGYQGGLYFNGSEAVEAYGGRPVPLFSSYPYKPGSSTSHLADYVFSGPNQLLMNSSTGTGPGKQTIGEIEQSVLADIGYTVVANPMFAWPTITVPATLTPADTAVLV